MKSKKVAKQIHKDHKSQKGGTTKTSTGRGRGRRRRNTHKLAGPSASRGRGPGCAPPHGRAERKARHRGEMFCDSACRSARSSRPTRDAEKGRCQGRGSCWRDTGPWPRKTRVLGRSTGVMGDNNEKVLDATRRWDYVNCAKID